MLEKDLEDILVKYPGLIEDGLELLGRQVSVFGRRMDLLFKDRLGRKLIVELKYGPIKDEHIGQLLSYEGMLLSAEDPLIRVMLIGTRVPPNIARTLDHHGIAWKEITYFALKEFINKNHDAQFGPLFDEEMLLTNPGNNTTAKAKPMRAPLHTNANGIPALMIPLQGEWITQAEEHFRTGQQQLYFYTNGNIGQARTLPVKRVYFKATGETVISAYADFIEVTTENPRQYRLKGREDNLGRFYYGFRNLKSMQTPIELTSLQYYTTGGQLRNDVPGSCIIIDPLTQDE
jgi:hypothetical protein